MACPTCDHTMHSFGALGNGTSIFWCPRCGTLKKEFTATKAWSYESESFEPKLPERVRDFLNLLRDQGSKDDDKWRASAWTRGLYESCMINPEYPK